MQTVFQQHPFGRTLLIAMALLFTLPLSIAAEPPADMQGWEIDSPYNQLYDARELDSFKGYVRKIYTLVPMPGMAPATALLVAESEEDLNVVHVCPEWFAGPGDIGVRRGDRVKVKGVWAEIDGEFVFMASKVKKGDYFDFKVRITKDGTPFWTLTPEEQEKHRN
ncbi:MAG: hypothetical protein QNI88_16580 [Desulfobacterales bacterium]|nr:hypothetical protein [Desulfobacterales bacterium]